MKIIKVANLICTGGSASREGGGSRSDHPRFEAKTPVEGFFPSGGHFILKKKLNPKKICVLPRSLPP